MEFVGEENEEPCYYRVLGIDTNANGMQVRKAYKRLARRYHPDKSSTLKGNPQAQDHTPDGLSNHDMFSLIARAYETLIDPTKRASYDYLHGRGSISGTKMMVELRRKDAEQAVDLMKLTFDIKRRGELAKRGLVIDDAIYGSRSTFETGNMELVEKSSTTLNVTRPLQCLVENSRLVIPAGESKAYLSGFYDPCPGEEKLLWIRYYFRGKLHRVLVEDDKRLLVPLKNHLICNDNKRNPILSPVNLRPTTTLIKTETNLSLFRFGMISALGLGLIFAFTLRKL